MISLIKIRNNRIDFLNENKLYHRIRGPARITYDFNGIPAGSWWYRCGRKHTLLGPAIQYYDRKLSWYIIGKEYTKEKFNEITQHDR